MEGHIHLPELLL